MMWWSVAWSDAQAPRHTQPWLGFATSVWTGREECDLSGRARGIAQLDAKIAEFCESWRIIAGSRRALPQDSAPPCRGCSLRPPMRESASSSSATRRLSGQWPCPGGAANGDTGSDLCHRTADPTLQAGPCR